MCSHRSGGWKCHIKVTAGLDSLHGLWGKSWFLPLPGSGGSWRASTWGCFPPVLWSSFYVPMSLSHGTPRYWPEHSFWMYLGRHFQVGLAFGWGNWVNQILPAAWVGLLQSTEGWNGTGRRKKAESLRLTAPAEMSTVPCPRPGLPPWPQALWLKWNHADGFPGCWLAGRRLWKTSQSLWSS